MCCEDENERGLCLLRKKAKKRRFLCSVLCLGLPQKILENRLSLSLLNARKTHDETRTSSETETREDDNERQEGGGGAGTFFSSDDDVVNDDFKKGGGGEKIRDKSFPPALRSSLRLAVFLLAHLSINNVL